MLNRIVPLPIAVVMVLSAAAASSPSPAQVTELFISEYVEGTSFNKAIEIYNGTGSPVDLAAGGYRLVIYFNGNLIVGSNIALVGTVEPGDVYVVARDRADPAILAEADLASNQNFFNGDDTVLLMKGGAVVDSFGQLGVDPNDEWPGDVVTRDRTLRRLPDHCRGDVFLDDTFVASSLDWQELPTDTFDGLGRHEVLAGCESCPAAAELTCAVPMVAGSNADPGRTRIYDRYGCLSSSYRGAEIIYAFEPPVDGRYRLRLDDLTADLDLVVLGPGDCRANLCAGASDSSGIGSEEVSFDAHAGETYFVVVDGVGGAVSAYTLELSCPVAPVAAFASLPEFPTTGDEIRFFDASDGDPTSWTWDFGDGTTAAGKNPRHVFTSPGTYTVTLTVANSTSGDSASRPVTVAPPAATLSLAGPAGGRAGALLTFTASAQGCQPSPTGWQWRTGGGEVTGDAAGDTLRVRWESSGTKVLTVANSGCGDAADTRAVEIAPASVGAPPPAPSGLVSEPLSPTEVRLRWTDPSAAAEAFRVERRRDDGPFEPLAQVPGERSATEVSVADTANPTRNPTTFRVFALNAAGASPSSNEVTATTEPGSCDSSKTLCLLNKRFQVELTWRDPGGHVGTGRPVPLTRDTGYFCFFDAGNVEVVVKVLDARSFSGYFWVFFGSLSNVEYTLRVTDTQTGNTRTYFNANGNFASVGDTTALPGDMAVLGDSERPRKRDDRRSRVVARAASAVDFSWTPTVPGEGGEVLFEDLTAILAPRVDRLWDFGDGTEPVSTRDDPRTRHRFSTSGSFNVTLFVMEPGDISAQTATRRVQVAAPPDPRISLDVPRAIATGIPATLAATANEDCAPVRPQGWQWDVADGVISGAANRSSIEVLWSTPGVKPVEVTNSGCSSAFATALVQVTPTPPDPPPPQRCETAPSVLCLADNRFRLEVTWRDPAGNTGVGTAQRLTQETGHFWFFSPDNIELVIKVLDGRCFNGHFWVFYGALSNVGFDLTVTDTETGSSKTYHNPPGRFASTGDVQALPGECPMSAASTAEP